jgi:hypothetical protein
MTTLFGPETTTVVRPIPLIVPGGLFAMFLASIGM